MAYADCNYYLISIFWEDLEEFLIRSFGFGRSKPRKNWIGIHLAASGRMKIS